MFDLLPAQLCDAAEGLHYLHTNKIVHGDIKGVRLPPPTSTVPHSKVDVQRNILITNGMPARACLADFGLSTLTPSGVPGEMTTVTTGGTLLYMAPELLFPDKFGKKNGRPTQPGDIYAFGMTVYEVLTGLEPFYDRDFFERRGKYQLIDTVLGGARPTKPSDTESIGFGGGTWELVEECWMEESTERPTTERVLAHLSLVVTFSVVVGPTPKTPRKSDNDSSESH